MKQCLIVYLLDKLLASKEKRITYYKNVIKKKEAEVDSCKTELVARKYLRMRKNVRFVVKLHTVFMKLRWKKKAA